MVEFRNCCCCVPLRVGCLIIGYLNLIASIFLTVGYILALIRMVASSNAQADKNVTRLVVMVLLAVVLKVVTVLLIFSLLLVIGIHKDRRGYVKAFLIYYLIATVLFAIMYIVGVSILPPFTDISYVFGFVGLIKILPNVYFLLVIRSYWVTMLLGENLNSA